MLVVIKQVKYGQSVTDLRNQNREKDRSVTLGPEPASGDWWKKAVVTLVAWREAQVDVTGLSWSPAVMGAHLRGGGAALCAAKQPVRPTVVCL